MRRRSLLMLGAAGAGCAGPGRPQAAPAPDAGSTPLHLLRTGDIGALPAIEFSLAGVPTRWLVDSGATTALVTPALAARLGLKRLSPVRVALAGGVQSLERYALPALPLPGGDSGGMSAVAMELDDVLGTAGASLDGLLGAPWLRQRVTRFDFAAATLGTGETGVAPSSRAVALPLRWDNGLPVLRLAIGARAPEDFLLDTGNAGALVVFAERARRLLAEVGSLPETVVQELGGAVRARHALIERLTATGFVASQVPAALEAGATSRRGGHFERLAGSLGVALFEAGSITLDAPASRLWIDLPDLPEPPPLPGGFGLALARPQSALIVASVIAGGPAALADIAAGDALRAIDGVDVRAWRPAQAWQVLAGRNRADFEFLRDSGTQRHVTLQRARFFPSLR